MILIITMQALALILLITAFYTITGYPEARGPSGKKIRLLIGATALCLLGGITTGIMIKIQETTGRDLQLSGGIKSDARQWLSRHGTTPPTNTDVGQNIRILRDGLQFLRSHQAQLSQTPEAQNVITRYGQLPPSPTRLLSRTEENEYHQGAKAVHTLITHLADQTPPTNNAPAPSDNPIQPQ